MKESCHTMTLPFDSTLEDQLYVTLRGMSHVTSKYVMSHMNEWHAIKVNSMVMCHNMT